MAVINFGSLNIDNVYRVEHFVRPGETMQTLGYSVFAGGKGLNQSVALARAGAKVFHAVPAGTGSEFLLELLQSSGVDTSLILRAPAPQGHAVIQVNEKGENCIFLFAGSNAELTKEYADSILENAPAGSFVLLQNETSNVPYIIRRAAALGHRVVFNAAPFTPDLLKIDLKDISWLLVNEIEGAQFSGEQEPERILAALNKINPEMGVVLTLGSEGSLCGYKGEIFAQPIFPVEVCDTTAAGDTYTGFFLAALDSGKPIPEAMRIACAASAIAVSRTGAAPSVPTLSEVGDFLQTIK